MFQLILPGPSVREAGTGTEADTMGEAAYGLALWLLLHYCLIKPRTTCPRVASPTAG